MKPLLVTSGEPAGIGPDLCCALTRAPYPLVVMGDITLLTSRAQLLNQTIIFRPYLPGHTSVPDVAMSENTIWVWSVPLASHCEPGVLNPQNANYVVNMLKQATKACLDGYFSGIVTAPVHKGIINEAGIAFTGHTELLAMLCGVDKTVMMLTCPAMKVALVTTHLPLQAVSSAITAPLIMHVVEQVASAFKKDFGINNACLRMAGVNPHAGEGGHLGREEIDILEPAIKALQARGINIQGPYSADTLFTPFYLNNTDAFIAMYHDQGLPVLKYAGFGQAVNVTLGLPIVRTSVDHGTALHLAGTGKASVDSLFEALKMAAEMAYRRTAEADI